MSLRRVATLLHRTARTATTGRRGVVQLVSGTAAGQVVLVAVSPILSRLYGPADFAVLQVFTGVVALTAVLAGLRLELAIPLAVDTTQARAVYRAGLIAVVVVALLVGLTGAVTMPLWVEGATLRGLASHWWLVPPTLAALAVFQLTSALLVRTEQYGRLAVRNAVQGWGTAATQLGLGAAGVRPLGLLAGLGVGRVAGLALMLPSLLGLGRTRGDDHRRPERVSAGAMLAALRRFRRFPLVTSWSGLLNVAGQYAPFFVFALAYDDRVTGWLAFTARLLAAPVTLIGQAVAQVFLGRGASVRRAGTGELPRLTWQAVRRLFFVGAPPAAVLAIAGPWLFGLVFGADWERSGQYAQVLAVAFLAQFVAGPIGNVFHLVERQGVALAWDAVRLALVVAAPLLVGLGGGSDLAAVTAYAGVLAFSYVGVLGLAWRVVRHA